MILIIECEKEDDGRWIAEIEELPGVLAYGSSQNEAMSKVEALALRVLAEQLENGELNPVDINISIPEV
ncbi:MAG: type II toxin-antitoxin system HicB family antitoxin [Desulfamplus sp.]|nr:type II toxin-antitoxin system HicB family antitoxin [Desulfamplus sp.]MBF0390658.1 type II toxin-antitoxin system HicB family antitoxin [Desulfamplus sp.]